MLHIETWEENEILRTKSQDIKQSELKKYIKLGKEMIKYIKDPKARGVGLAAPQVGINKRIIAVSLLRDREDENFSTIMMINPAIIEHNNKKESEKEGCLSLPWETGSVARWTEIKIIFIDEKGKEKKLILKGLSARIVQHEIDHLEGVLFTDKVGK